MAMFRQLLKRCFEGGSDCVAQLVGCAVVFKHQRTLQFESSHWQCSYRYGQMKLKMEIKRPRMAKLEKVFKTLNIKLQFFFELLYRRGS